MKKISLLFLSVLSLQTHGQECLPIEGARGFYLINRTHFFAQEYTGADLVRDELIRNKIEIPSDKVMLIDSIVLNHAYDIMNLISSQTYSAPIPLLTPSLRDKFNETYFVLDNQGKAKKGAEIWMDYAKKCSKEKNCPSFINKSMIVNSPFWFGPIEALSKENSIIIAAAGNDENDNGINNEAVPDLSLEASRKYNYLLVGSTNPNGSITSTSRSAEEVVITAPSGFHIMTGGFLGKEDDQVTYAKTGQTSGAAPQVTAAMVIFETIADYHPSLNETKFLLSKTAIKLKHSHDIPRLHGAGNLNTLKIFEVAKRINKKCSGDAACSARAIFEESTYEFSINKSSLKSSKEAFPNCFNLPTDIKNTCSDKKEGLKNLRKAYLLNPEDKEVTQGLSCIYKELNFPDNAKYYLEVSKFN